jgi:hypothetical protein
MHAVFRSRPRLARWFGLGFLGLCCLAAIAVLVNTDFNVSGQDCAAALLLLGFCGLASGHLLSRIGLRRVRRRRSRYSHADGSDGVY